MRARRLRRRGGGRGGAEAAGYSLLITAAGGEAMPAATAGTQAMRAGSRGGTWVGRIGGPLVCGSSPATYAPEADSMVRCGVVKGQRTGLDHRGGQPVSVRLQVGADPTAVSAASSGESCAATPSTRSSARPRARAASQAAERRARARASVLGAGEGDQTAAAARRYGPAPRRPVTGPRTAAGVRPATVGAGRRRFRRAAPGRPRPAQARACRCRRSRRRADVDRPGAANCAPRGGRK